MEYRKTQLRMEMEQEAPTFSTADLIKKECENIKNILLEKNSKYGDSAFNNGVVFDVPPLTALKARINDKVSRIKNSLPGDEEDSTLDLIGYLILYRIKSREEYGNIL